MPSKTIEDFAYQVRDYMRSAEVVEGKNHAYSQENNAVIATIENGNSYKVRWTGSATVTLKKNSASGTEVTSGSTSPLSFTADSDFDLYFGSSADVTEIMVYDGNDTSDTYEPYYVPVKDRVDELEEDEDVTSLFTVVAESGAQINSGWSKVTKCGKCINGVLRFTLPSTVTENAGIIEFPSSLNPASFPSGGMMPLCSLVETWTGAIKGVLSISSSRLVVNSNTWTAGAVVFANFTYYTK